MAINKIEHSSDLRYFASVPYDEIGNVLDNKVRNFTNYISSVGLDRLWSKSHQKYYDAYYNMGEIKKTGDQQQKRKIHVNDYRNLIQHLLVLTTSQRVSYEPRAVNSDYRSGSQCIVARSILDYYLKQEKLEDLIIDATFRAILLGEGWMLQEWDWTKGKTPEGINGEENIQEEASTGREELESEDEELLYDAGGSDVEGGELEQEQEDGSYAGPESTVKTGDIRFTVFSPYDVIRDASVRDTHDHEWFIFRRMTNKYTLAAKYPDFADKIIQYKYEEEDIMSQVYYGYNTTVTDEYKKLDSDLIPEYTFMHKPTSALPEGRKCVFVDGDCVMFDGPLPVEDWQAHVIMPDYLHNTPFGFTTAFDLLPIQEGLDMLNSTIITNQNAFGVTNILVHAAANLNVDDLGGNLNMLTYSGDPNNKPEPLKLLDTPREIFEHLGNMSKQAETISGINSTVRGNPEASLKSGAALALVTSQSVQFNNGLERSYNQFTESIGTGIITLMKKYAVSPRFVTITGKNNKSYLEQFTGDDLVSIDRVIVERGNPINRTAGGKIEIAQDMMKQGFIKTPEQYLEVLNTGRLDPLMEGELKELMLIRKENEELMEGAQQPVTQIDEHILHIKEHRCVLASPEARQQAAVVQETLNHINMHIQALQTANPFLLSVLGMPSLAPPPPPTGEAPGPLKQQPPVAGMPNMPNMPNLPAQADAGTQQAYDQQLAAIPPQ